MGLRHARKCQLFRVVALVNWRGVVIANCSCRSKFDANLKKGTLAVISGKMVKQSPESMKVRTPSAIMGVRGTEFIVQVDEPAASR